MQLFGPACLVYLLSDVRPTVELGDYLNQEGVFNPFLPDLNNSPESKYLEAFGTKKLQSSSFTVCLFQEEEKNKLRKLFLYSLA
ncbi:MAG: hypothetical protein A3E26_01225 [Chlamydiae bacterium RIFCSPHIGHO2_12_FULL_49_32]|nr:MAG: hypothetical protein A3E26_01225 [Chlamydiae bacterium RIFCSPHIGHO2_12_FULL_49_32]